MISIKKIFYLTIGIILVCSRACAFPYLQNRPLNLTKIQTIAIEKQNNDPQVIQDSLSITIKSRGNLYTSKAATDKVYRMVLEMHGDMQKIRDQNKNGTPNSKRIWDNYDREYEALTIWHREILGAVYDRIINRGLNFFNTKAGFISLWICGQLIEKFIVLFNNYSKEVKEIENTYLKR